MGYSKSFAEVKMLHRVLDAGLLVASKCVEGWGSDKKMRLREIDGGFNGLDTEEDDIIAALANMVK